MTAMIKIVFMVALLAAIIILGPLITIWSLNTLFPVLDIPTNIATWFATLWIFAFTAYKGTK